VKGNDLIKCVQGIVEISGVKKQAVIGMMKDKIKIDGVDCLLNKKILEG